MFAKDKEPTSLDLAMNRAFLALDKEPVHSEEYATILDRVSTLHKLKAEDKPKRVSPDTLVMVGANLLGIMLIIRHEHVNVITSRAMNFVLKPVK